MQYVDDGNSDFSLGMDGYTNPDRIQNNQFARGVNVSTRGGTLSPRPPYVHQQLVFEHQLIDTKYRQRTIADIWSSGKFQALIPLPQGPDNYLLTIISGLIFKTNVKTLVTQLLSEEFRVDQHAPRINWTFAGGKLVVFDYPDYPLIVDIFSVRRATIDDVPISRLGVYNQNRLFVANAGVELTAGDPVGGLLASRAPLSFDEVFTPSSPFYQQIFSLPVEDAIYPITAMGFIQLLDSSTGIGPLFVATEKKVYSYAVQQPRAQWGQGAFGSVLLDNVGMAGARAFVNVNSDLVFLSSSGQIHALSSARDAAKKWGDVPISREVQPYLKYTAPELLNIAVLGYFDNRIFISANPYRVGASDRNGQPITDYAHGGFVVLELQAMATFLQQGTPVWSGLWTGVNPMEIAVIGDRCFIMSKDGEFLGTNRLYELDRKSLVDTVENRERRVRSVVTTKRFDFEKPFEQKIEHTLTLHMNDLKGQVDLHIDRKPTHSPVWLHYRDWQHEAPVKTCDFPGDAFINGFAAHQLKELMFGDGVEGGNSELNGDDYTNFRGVQYRLQIEGEYWEIEHLKLRAALQERAEMDDTRLSEAQDTLTYIAEECEVDWLISIEDLCQSSSFIGVTKPNSQTVHRFVADRLDPPAPIIIQGIPGPPGPQGPPGDTGPAGVAGPAGAAGTPGAPGSQGPAGVDGVDGAPGAPGAQGLQGLQGAQGPIGLTGAAGAPGAQGPAGVAGPAGAVGPQGPIGLTGPAGADGSPGVDGAPGATGPAGPEGPIGPEGPPGTGGDDVVKTVSTGTLDFTTTDIAALDVSDAKSWSANFADTFTGTAVFESSLDNVIWEPLIGYDINSDPVAQFTAPGTFYFNTATLMNVRVRVATTGTGTSDFTFVKSTV